MLSSGDLFDVDIVLRRLGMSTRRALGGVQGLSANVLWKCPV